MNITAMLRTVFIIVCFLFSIAVSTARAANFSLSVNASYAFAESGSATVKQTVRLTNATSESYASVYFLDLPADASDIKAFDQNGKLEPQIVEEAGNRRLKLPLATQQYGMYQSSQFVITYQSSTFAQKQGDAWQIVIPALQSSETTAAYSVVMELPKAWGIPRTWSPYSSNGYQWNFDHPPYDRIEVTVSNETVDTPTPPVTVITEEKNEQPYVRGVVIGTFLFVFIFFISRYLNK